MPGIQPECSLGGYMGKRIVLTGGGTAGHVMPIIALLDELRKEGFELHFVGTEDGIEHSLMSRYDDVSYHAVSSGKFRRGLSFGNIKHNFVDVFNVLKGIKQAKRLIAEIKPDVVFSKGGYVSVPVVMAAKNKAHIVIHECDYTPGLANKIASRYADDICVSFEDTLDCFKGKGVYTGTPIRRELLSGDRSAGLEFLAFDGKKPILLIMGGSLGAKAINDAVTGAMDELVSRFDIVHICGKGKRKDALESIAGYRQIEFIADELKDVFACTDVMLTRAGANAVFEILSLAIPAILVPLPKEVSRGDQLKNAAYFARKGYSVEVEQRELDSKRLVDELTKLYDNRKKYIAAMTKADGADAVDRVMDVILKKKG